MLEGALIGAVIGGAVAAYLHFKKKKDEANDANDVGANS